MRCREVLGRKVQGRRGQGRRIPGHEIPGHAMRRHRIMDGRPVRDGASAPTVRWRHRIGC